MPRSLIRVSFMNLYISLFLSTVISISPAISTGDTDNETQLRQKIAQLKKHQQEVSTFIDLENASWEEALKKRREADDAMMIVLIGELMNQEPAAPDLGDYAPLRWQAIRRGGDPIKALNEAEALFKSRPDLQSSQPEMALELAWYHSVLESPQDAVVTAHKYADAYPEMAEGALLLEAATARINSDSQQVIELQSRIVTEYPDTPSAYRVELGQPNTEIWADPIFVNQMNDIATGNVISSHDFDGNVTLIAHWANWCSPAHIAIKEAVDVYKLHHDQGFQVLGMSGDRNLENASDFIEKHSLPWGNISVPWNQPVFPQSAMEFWSQSYSPRFLLVDGQGRILAQPKQSQLHSYVQKAMAGKLPLLRRVAVSYDPENLTGQRAVP